MSAQLLEGKPIADRILADLKREITELEKQAMPPRLAAVQIGESPGSKVYAKQQEKNCTDIGIHYDLKQLPAETQETGALRLIEELNEDESITGIILLMPVPLGINPRKLQRRIRPLKDIEGMHPENLGKLFYSDLNVSPCTAESAYELAKYSGATLMGKEAVIVGHSDIAGKPLAMLLLSSPDASPTVTVCHIATRNLAAHTRNADILFVAVGKPNLITAEMVKEGVIVIDIGINRVTALDESGKPVLNSAGRPRKRIAGDVDFENVKEKASVITPVPGGVGVLTTAMMLRNTVRTAQIIARRKLNKQ
ncbi:MAG: bifunctional 5,10-methylenetetrahydrofolate dehydrogenase/5,10-methenyltetrahydrofolate cyclohydrolase [Kiritimatiellia bacterium]